MNSTELAPSLTPAQPAAKNLPSVAELLEQLEAIKEGQKILKEDEEGIKALLLLAVNAVGKPVAAAGKRVSVEHNIVKLKLKPKAEIPIEYQKIALDELKVKRQIDRLSQDTRGAGIEGLQTLEEFFTWETSSFVKIKKEKEEK